MAEYKKPQPVATPKLGLETDPNTLTAKQMTKKTGTPRVGMGDPASDNTKTDGITIRGCGAATKGTKARGPMA